MRRLAFQDDHFDVPQLAGLKVERLAGFADVEDRPLALLLYLSDGSVHHLFLDASLGFWSRLSPEQVADTWDDWDDDQHVDYTPRFPVEGATIVSVRCARGERTAISIQLNVGELRLSQVDGRDPDSASELVFEAASN